MAATIRVARGNKASKGTLLYGELFWQKPGTGEEGTLYIGNPDGSGAPDLKIAGARAMKSLYYRGQHSGGSFPENAKPGDYWIMSSDGTSSISDYRQNDWIVCIGESQFTRINNSGGISTEVSFDNSNTNFDATTVDSALRELEAEKLQYIRTLMDSSEVPSTPVIGGFYLIGKDGVTIDGTSYKKGDFAYYDSQEWVRIASGFTDASDIDFDNSTVTRPIGSPVISVTVQEALTDLYAKKADLDGSGKVPTSQLPDTVLGALQYQGTWSASSGAYPTSVEQGDYYVTDSAGEVEHVNDSNETYLIHYEVGDWAVFDGLNWSKVDNSERLSGIVVKGDNLSGSPEIRGSGKVDVSSSGNVITVAGQNLVDKDGATTPGAVPKFTADGTIGDSHISEDGQKVDIDADLVVGREGTLNPKTTKLHGPLTIQPTGVAGEKTDHGIKLGTEQPGGETRYAEVKAPRDLSQDVTITTPDETSTLVGQKESTTPNRLTKVDSDGFIKDSQITDDGTKVTVDAPLEAPQGLTSSDVAITDNNGNKVTIDAPSLTEDTTLTLPSESGTLATLADVQAAEGGATGALESAIDGTANKVAIFTDQHEVGDSIIEQKSDNSGIEVGGTVQAKADMLIASSDGSAKATFSASSLVTNVVQTVPDHSGTLLNDHSTIDGGEF